MSEKPKNSAGAVSRDAKRPYKMLTIFITVFIDLVGFGIIIPLSPYLATQFQASALEVGLLMSIYSLMQFIFAPVWGKISDRVGRRPVLLLSILGGVLSYIGFAFAASLPILFVARALAGIFGANISTAMAYIADITDEKDRSKSMGLVGAAFGLGFVLGPFLGAEFGSLGERLGNAPPFGISFSALLAALLCLVNFVFAWFFLEESLSPDSRKVARRAPRFALLKLHLGRPVVGQLMLVFLVSGLSMALMESTLFLLVKDEFGWGLRTSGWGFAYIGLMIAFTQGYLIRRWMPRWGEKRIMLGGLILLFLGFYGIMGADQVWLLAVVMTLVALGNGLGNPAILGSISLLSPRQEQGEAMGVTHSLSAMSRILGPALGGWLYGNLGHRVPFLVAGSITFLAWLLVVRVYKHLPDAGRESSVQPAEL